MLSSNFSDSENYSFYCNGMNRLAYRTNKIVRLEGIHHNSKFLGQNN